MVSEPTATVTDQAPALEAWLRFWFALVLLHQGSESFYDLREKSRRLFQGIYDSVGKNGLTRSPDDLEQAALCLFWLPFSTSEGFSCALPQSVAKDREHAADTSIPSYSSAVNCGWSRILL